MMSMYITAIVHPNNENGLKFFSIRVRILNSEYFFLNLIFWFQLNSIGFNWIQLD